jgi:hypothetical protein
MTITDKITERMAALNWSVQTMHGRLADAGYQCSERTVRNWVSGKTDIPRLAIGKLSVILGMDPADLVHAEGPRR